MNILTKQLFDKEEFELGNNPIDEAYEDLLIKANDGDSRAQYLIGCFYYYGRRVETNHSIASNWFKKSAEQNLVDAQTILGYQYMYGDGVNKDIEKAIELLEKAQAQGSAYACFLLGKIYHFDSQKRNRFTASGYYVWAIEMGSTEAKRYRADMYMDTGDYKEALDLYVRALKEGCVESAYNAANIFEYGRGCNVNNELAFNLYLHAAQNEVMMAQHNVGAYYYNAKYVEKDIQKAFEWYLKAANQGSAMSQHNIGMMYYNGDLIQDLDVALAWFKKSFQSGYLNSERFINEIEIILSEDYIKN
ncbi:sel1 repeat family protein [Candidatus Methylopumilus planktonicus]|uniref:tetratricopeptide repeat protein n=1 Tax=Candidatus Methylopumilus planktonicus TaxID=1581557 RepID=UPI00112260C2|nr:tetratricopeptide repeat protein [Candidatus Methylopumilus planktonicus]QDD06739.1 sel1 repeat family protein [Candidatus Methylopumilus planktonicus]QDD08075.1 sel1 repeat family protein [Candidatus Methylopumilus planktonicus]